MTCHKLTLTGLWVWFEFQQCRLIARPPHDDVIKCKHFPRYWPFVRGIHRSPVNSALKCQWCGALMFSLICVWINGKQSWGWWFETLSRPLWRHCNECISTCGFVHHNWIIILSCVIWFLLLYDHHHFKIIITCQDYGMYVRFSGLFHVFDDAVCHDKVILWKLFPCGAMMVSSLLAWTRCWLNSCWWFETPYCSCDITLIVCNFYLIALLKACVDWVKAMGIFYIRN